MSDEDSYNRSPRNNYAHDDGENQQSRSKK